MKKILLAEDDEAQALVCQKELEAEGYTVLLAGDGQAALDLLAKQKIDLVILDIRMPQMDGIETLGKILSGKPGIPVIFYTAFDSYRESFLTWGADAYVLKSPDMSELKKKVREILNHTDCVQK